jgi:GCN5-like protein 1 (GCN5L1)
VSCAFAKGKAFGFIVADMVMLFEGSLPWTSLARPLKEKRETVRDLQKTSQLRLKFHPPIKSAISVATAWTERRAGHFSRSFTMDPKQQLQASLTSIDKRITSTIHSRLTTIYANDTSLSKQSKSLQSRTHEARKHQDNWDRLVRAGRNGIKVVAVSFKLIARI